MADVHYQGFMAHRPPVPMVRSLSFHGLPTGHGIWQTPALPLDIPGASPPRRSRRLPYLLSVSVPDNADAVLSRSLLEQFRLDSISDNSPRSSSLKQHSSWASKVFSEVAGSNKASLSTCASSHVQEDATAQDTHSSIVGGTETDFAKKKATEKRPALQASALSAALRESLHLNKEKSNAPTQSEPNRPLSRDAHQAAGPTRHQGRVEILQRKHDSPETVGLPLPPGQTSKEEQQKKQAVPILIPPIQCLSPDTSCTGSTSSTGTGYWDWPDTSSPGLMSQSGQREALLDRLMEYCYAILANKYTEFKGEASASGGPSSASSSHQDSARGSQDHRQSGHDKSKKRTSHNESEASGDSDDDEGNRGLASKRVKMEENMGKRLACPFFKRNPQRYQEERSCVGPGWRTVHRLK